MRRFIKLVCGALARTTTAIKARAQQQQEPSSQEQQGPSAQKQQEPSAEQQQELSAEQHEYEPRLLQLPVELILSITDFLPAEDAAVLSLTCKCLFQTLSSQLLHSLAAAPREELLLRLERDLGASHFYCSYCSKLHCFLSLPGCRELRMPESDRCTGMVFQPSNYQYWLPYYHGRLVMNRHFYGAPSGLPLETLSAVVLGLCADYHWRRGAPWWTAEFTGAIIQDELVLHAKHVLESTSLNALWVHVEEQYHCICHHLETYNWTMYRSCQQKTRKDSSHRSAQAVQYGSGSCSECPTDYTVEVTKTEAQDRTSHKITVYSYHLMGSFRSHHDRNWRGMTDQSMDGENEAIISGTYVPGDWDQLKVPPGFVRKKWLSQASP